MKNLAVFFSGLLFGLGLAVSGMTDPAKVIGFLDVAGRWNPTLAFVMGGAVIVTFFAFRRIMRRERPVFAQSFELPEKKTIDGKLVGGAAVFGIGWGIGGFCPGPAVVALVSGVWPVFAFVAAMLAGMALHAILFEGESVSRREPLRMRGRVRERS
ncbi:MAG: YeeE/YedE family protein [Rubrobacteraceae bacterium]|uniref:DUF6691 family protein n=1 Tax=Rubrobacter naiadicus TaxID=1392641 RepID=UPI00236113D2|nr:DUF6691 family protein [Rubrobacter naiadicus]MBX6763746.1 YeeE/YedE family protein [Rubrobacteraceae bacterium]MCL6437079.1 YeeE/YedE family protein [Rubrobacteraceae bacterium]